MKPVVSSCRFWGVDLDNIKHTKSDCFAGGSFTLAGKSAKTDGECTLPVHGQCNQTDQGLRGSASYSGPIAVCWFDGLLVRLLASNCAKSRKLSIRHAESLGHGHQSLSLTPPPRPPAPFLSVLTLSEGLSLLCHVYSSGISSPSHGTPLSLCLSYTPAPTLGPTYLANTPPTKGKSLISQHP